MSRKISILVVVSSLLYNSYAFAWGWKDAVNQAIDRNPSLQSQKEATEIAEMNKANARSLMYPTVMLNGGAREYQDYTRNFRHQLYLGPSLQYLLYSGGKVRAGIDVSSAQDTQAELSLRANSVVINSRLRQAYAVALREKRYLDLTHRIEEQRHENFKFTKIRYESGLEYKWVYLSSGQKWQQAQLDAQQAEMNKKTALADLENLLGSLSIQSVQELSDDDFYTADKDYNLDELISKINENPKYLLQASNVEEAKSSVEYSKAEYYPRIGFQGDVGVVKTERRDFFPLSQALVPYWVVGASLSMPLYEGQRIRRNVAISKAMLIQRKFDLEQTQLDLKTNLQKTYQAYVIAKQQVEISKQSVEATKDRSKVVSNQYKSGLTTFLDWESSQDGWVNAEIKLLNDIRDYQNAWARLEEAMGVELSRL